MNNAGRKELKKIFQLDMDAERLAVLGSDAEARYSFSSVIDDMSTEVQNILDEEQEKFDNMPESLQGGSKGDELQEVLYDLEAAVDALESAITKLGDWDAEYKEFNPEAWAEEVMESIEEAASLATNV